MGEVAGCCPDWGRLFETVAAEQGLFTTKQAADTGYSPQLLVHDVHAGGIGDLLGPGVLRQALAREDLVAMLHLLGARDDSYYAGMPATIAQVGIRRVPDRTRGARGLNRRYDLALRHGNAADASLVTRFVDRIRDLLDAWTQETVEIAAEIKLMPGIELLLKEGGAGAAGGVVGC